MGLVQKKQLFLTSPEKGDKVGVGGVEAAVNPRGSLPWSFQTRPTTLFQSKENQSVGSKD